MPLRGRNRACETRRRLHQLQMCNSVVSCFHLALEASQRLAHCPGIVLLSIYPEQHRSVNTPQHSIQQHAFLKVSEQTGWLPLKGGPTGIERPIFERVMSSNSRLFTTRFHSACVTQDEESCNPLRRQ